MPSLRHRSAPLAIAAVVAVSAIAGLWAAHPATASSGGRIGFSGNPATNDGALCSRCHTGGITPTVTLDGPIEVDAGATAMLTLTVAGGQAALAGLNVSATGGMLAVPDGATDVQIIEGELTQTEPKAVGDDDAAVFAFLWQAPEGEGTITLYAAGNSVDGNGRPPGDAAAGTTLEVVVGAGGSITPTATAEITATMTAEPITPTATADVTATMTTEPGTPVPEGGRVYVPVAAKSAPISH